MKTKSKAYKKILFSFLLGLFLVAPAFAAPVVDGIYDSSEGYTNGYWVDFNIQGGSYAEGGQLWYYQAAPGEDVYFNFIQPTSLVDNSYGANSVGWGSNAPSGKNHNFKDLLGSDSAELVFYDSSSNKVLNTQIDYIEGNGSGPYYARVENESVTGAVINVASSLQWNWQQFGSTNPELFGNNSSSPLTGSNTTYDVTDPALSDWIFDVIYEFQISGSLFSDQDRFELSQLSFEVVHDSPNKIGRNKVYPDPNNPVPVPGAIWLFGSGIIGLVGVRRRTK